MYKDHPEEQEGIQPQGGSRSTPSKKAHQGRRTPQAIEDVKPAEASEEQEGNTDVVEQQEELLYSEHAWSS